MHLDVAGTKPRTEQVLKTCQHHYPRLWRRFQDRDSWNIRSGDSKASLNQALLRAKWFLRWKEFLLTWGRKRSVSIFIILIVIFREVISKMHFNRSICPIITTKRMLFLCVIPVIGQPREDYIGLIRVHSLTASASSLLSNPSTFPRGERCLINILINSLRTKQWYKLSCGLTAKSTR